MARGSVFLFDKTLIARKSLVGQFDPAALQPASEGHCTARKNVNRAWEDPWKSK
jgi:hypothetical protein